MVKDIFPEAIMPVLQGTKFPFFSTTPMFIEIITDLPTRPKKSTLKN